MPESICGPGAAPQRRQRSQRFSTITVLAFQMGTRDAAMKVGGERAKPQEGGASVEAFDLLSPPERLRYQITYVIEQGWSPAVEHTEPEKSFSNFWYLWELPLFGERSVDRVLAELDACLAEHPTARAVAVADIGGLWTFESVTAALSDLAEAALRLAVGHLLLSAASTGELRLPSASEPAAGSGFTVLGMGKLGARELNYSSDIDLVVFFDPSRFPFFKRDEKRGAAVDIVRGMVRLLSEITADGYVFRTDLRLRPDAGATQIAISTEAAESYYESMGQNWERAAFIKARPCAGDAEASR